MQIVHKKHQNALFALKLTPTQIVVNNAGKGKEIVRVFTRNLCDVVRNTRRMGRERRRGQTYCGLSKEY